MQPQKKTEQEIPKGCEVPWKCLAPPPLTWLILMRVGFEVQGRVWMLSVSVRMSTGIEISQ